MVCRLLPIAQRQHRDNKTRLPTCPACKTVLETDRHLYSCPHADRKGWRSTLQQEITKQYIDDPFTDDTLASLFLEGLMAEIREEALPTVTIPKKYYSWW